MVRIRGLVCYVNGNTIWVTIHGTYVYACQGEGSNTIVLADYSWSVGGASFFFFLLSWNWRHINLEVGGGGGGGVGGDRG